MARWAPLGALVALIGSGGLPCHWGAVTPANAQTPAFTEVRVVLSEWGLTPSRISVPQGRGIRFLAVNAGALPHALAVDGPGIYAESDSVGSGQSAPLELTFTTAGAYDLFCPVNAGQHRALGQEGEVQVLAALDGVALPVTGTPVTNEVAPVLAGSDVTFSVADPAWAAGPAGETTASPGDDLTGVTGISLEGSFSGAPDASLEDDLPGNPEPSPDNSRSTANGG